MKGTVRRHGRQRQKAWKAETEGMKGTVRRHGRKRQKAWKAEAEGMKGRVRRRSQKAKSRPDWSLAQLKGSQLHCLY